MVLALFTLRRKTGVAGTDCAGSQTHQGIEEGNSCCEGPEGDEMSTIKESVRINAPVERVFAFLSDPNHLPEIWPSMMEVKNVVAHDGQRSFDWVYKMAGLRFEGHSDTLEFVPNERVVTNSKKGIPNTLTYSYARKGNAECEVTIQVDYEIPNKVLGKLAEPIVRRINEREATTLLGNLRDRMEIEQAMHAGTAQGQQPPTH
jgi:uncharacterized membrane protein